MFGIMLILASTSDCNYKANIVKFAELFQHVNMDLFNMLVVLMIMMILNEKLKDHRHDYNLSWWGY